MTALSGAHLWHHTLGRRRLLVLFLPLVCVFSLVVSHAASLGLHGSTLSVYSVADGCAPHGVAASAPSGSAASTSVLLSGVPAACGGRTVQLVAFRSDGSALSTAAAGGTLQVAAGSSSVVMPTFTVADVAGIALALDGWGTSATWTAPVVSPTGQWPVTPGSAGTVISASGVSMSNNPVQVCVDITVTTTSPTPVVWRVTVDMTAPPFNGQTALSTYTLQGADGWRYTTYGSTPSAGSFQVGGTTAGGRRTIQAGDRYVVSICNYRLPDPPVTPSAYTVTTTAPVYDAGQASACVTTTVAGNGTSDFYVGWSAPLDLQGARDLLSAHGRTFTHWSWSSNAWAVDRAQTAGTSTFLLTSAGAAAIKGTDAFVLVACAS